MYRISHRKFYTVLAVIFVLPAVLLSGCVPSRPAAAPSPTPLPQQPVVTAAPHQLDFAHEARPNTEGRAPSNLRPHLNFRQISREQGLSQSVIYAILQDRYGFIWIGTQDGLNRYDGYNFTVFEYNPENPNSLSNNTVLSLYEDRTGSLIRSSPKKGLSSEISSAARLQITSIWMSPRPSSIQATAPLPCSSCAQIQTPTSIL